MQKWSTYEINYLKENYENKGSEYCSKQLNRSLNSVRNKVRKLKLSINKELKSEIQSKNGSKYEKMVLSFENPQDLYIMGFLWADGYLHDTFNRLELYTTTEDFKTIEWLFDDNKWSISHRERVNKKPSTTLGLYQKNVCENFREYGYTGKSLYSPNFLHKIPENIIHYFFRGFFDGDGCFYVSKDNKQKQCYLAGSYEQDWSWVEDRLKKLNIDYTIKRKTQKGGKEKYSIVYIKKSYIKNFGFFIYENYDIDNIGLPRKYNKFLQIIN
ncbi:MAG: LAGLIDADG family homing endonuclease [bacterium]